MDLHSSLRMDTSKPSLVSSADGVRIDLPITQTELAQWCGLSREAVVKSLRKLRDLGWVTTTDGAVTVEEREAVRARGQL